MGRSVHRKSLTMNTHSPQVDVQAADVEPLVRRLLHHGPLSSAEIALLGDMAADRRRLKPGERLVVEGGACADMFILQSGACHASAMLKGGARQILRIHHQGDLMNTTAVGWTRVAASLTALTDAEVSRFPRTMLGRVFAEQPRLAAMLYGVAVVDNVSLNDRLKSLGRTDGRARIATLLLELNSRQRLNDGDDPDLVELYLTQSEIADAVGMTKVHVNRLLKELTQEGLIARDGRIVRLTGREALVAASDFVDRYAEMATDWLPEGLIAEAA